MTDDSFERFLKLSRIKNYKAMHAKFVDEDLGFADLIEFGEEDLRSLCKEFEFGARDTAQLIKALRLEPSSRMNEERRVSLAKSITPTHSERSSHSQSRKSNSSRTHSSKIHHRQPLIARGGLQTSLPAPTIPSHLDRYSKYTGKTPPQSVSKDDDHGIIRSKSADNRTGKKGSRKKQESSRKLVRERRTHQHNKSVTKSPAKKVPAFGDDNSSVCSSSAGSDFMSPPPVPSAIEHPPARRPSQSSITSENMRVGGRKNTGNQMTGNLKKLYEGQSADEKANGDRPEKSQISAITTPPNQGGRKELAESQAQAAINAHRGHPDGKITPLALSSRGASQAGSSSSRSTSQSWRFDGSFRRPQEEQLVLSAENLDRSSLLFDNCDTISQFAAMYKESLKQLESNCTARKKEIAQSFEWLRKRLNDYESELLSEVESQSRSKTDILTQKLQQVQKLDDDYSELKNQFQLVISTPSFPPALDASSILLPKSRSASPAMDSAGMDQDGHYSTQVIKDPVKSNGMNLQVNGNGHGFHERRAHRHRSSARASKEDPATNSFDTNKNAFYLNQLVGQESETHAGKEARATEEVKDDGSGSIEKGNHLDPQALPQRRPWGYVHGSDASSSCPSSSSFASSSTTQTSSSFTSENHLKSAGTGARRSTAVDTESTFSADTYDTYDAFGASSRTTTISAFKYVDSRSRPLAMCTCGQLTWCTKETCGYNGISEMGHSKYVSHEHIHEPSHLHIQATDRRITCLRIGESTGLAGAIHPIGVEDPRKQLKNARDIFQARIQRINMILDNPLIGKDWSSLYQNIDLSTDIVVIRDTTTTIQTLKQNVAVINWRKLEIDSIHCNYGQSLMEISWRHHVPQSVRRHCCYQIEMSDETSREADARERRRRKFQTVSLGSVSPPAPSHSYDRGSPDASTEKSRSVTKSRSRDYSPSPTAHISITSPRGSQKGMALPDSRRIKNIYELNSKRFFGLKWGLVARIQSPIFNKASIRIADLAEKKDGHLYHFRIRSIYNDDSSAKHKQRRRGNHPVMVGDYSDVKSFSIQTQGLAEIDSIILSDKEKDILLNFVQNGRMKKWRLLYRSSRYGFNAKAFHRRCDNKGPTVTVVLEGKTNRVIGGFTNIAWQSSEKGVHSDDKGAFLFRLRDNPKKYPFKENCTHAVYHRSTYGPTFGQLCFPLCIKFDSSDDSRKSHCDSSEEYGITGHNELMGSWQLIVRDCEVFALID